MVQIWYRDGTETLHYNDRRGYGPDTNQLDFVTDPDTGTDIRSIYFSNIENIAFSQIK